MSLFSLLCFLMGDVKSVILPYDFQVSVTFATEHGGWLHSDYLGTGVYRIDRTGKVLQSFSYGMGEGPGEFRNPRFLFEFPREQTIVVIGKHGDTHTFDSKSGAFKKKIISFLPYEGAVKWDEKHFLILWGKHVFEDKPGDAFLLYDLKGNLVRSWDVPQPKWQEKYFYQTTRGVAIDGKRNVYFGNMARPELFVYKPDYKRQTLWRLKPPKGFREAPERKLTRAEMMNKLKFQEYMGSFTFINNIHDVQGKYLVVSWINPKGNKRTFDVYKFEGRELLSSDNEVEGHIIGVTQNHVISMIPKDDFGEELKEESVLLMYPLFSD